MVLKLDEALDRDGLTKTDRRTVQHLICDVAEQLIVDTEDETLKEIYNKHSDADFDTEEQAAVSSMKATMESMFGVDLGNVADLNSPEDLLAQLEKQMEKAQQRRQEEQAGHAPRRKTAK